MKNRREKRNYVQCNTIQRIIKYNYFICLPNCIVGLTFHLCGFSFPSYFQNTIFSMAIIKIYETIYEQLITIKKD